MIADEPSSGIKGYIEILHTNNPDNFLKINYSVNGKNPMLILDATLQEKGPGFDQENPRPGEYRQCLREP